MIIYIDYFTHGSTIDNERKVASGWAQTPLSEKGIQQTKQAALFVTCEKYDAIYSSDLNRAKESALLLFKSRSDDIKIDTRLRECNYGDFTKKPNYKLDLANHINLPFSNGESLIDVQDRMTSFLQSIVDIGYKKIAIVSHRFPQLSLDVICNCLLWEEAIENDWRKNGKWKLGWTYTLDSKKNPFNHVKIN